MKGHAGNRPKRTIDGGEIGDNPASCSYRRDCCVVQAFVDPNNLDRLGEAEDIFGLRIATLYEIRRRGFLRSVDGRSLNDRRQYLFRRFQCNERS